MLAVLSKSMLACESLAGDLLLLCAFQELFEDPVIASDGYTYERSAIEDWISRGKRSPMTNQPLQNSVLISNHTLRGAVLLLSADN